MWHSLKGWLSKVQPLMEISKKLLGSQEEDCFSKDAILLRLKPEEQLAWVNVTGLASGITHIHAPAN